MNGNQYFQDERKS